MNEEGEFEFGRNGTLRFKPWKLDRAVGETFGVIESALTNAGDNFWAKEEKRTKPVEVFWGWIPRFTRRSVIWVNANTHSYLG